MVTQICKFKNNGFLLLVLFFQCSFSQSVTGKWKTVDDETGKEKSVVEIFEKNGKIYGKVITILEEENRYKKCTECEGDDKNKPIQGLTIIKGLTKEDASYSNGKILDPKNGKLYKCTLSLEEKDKLKVRGYIGFSLLGRTQYWYRVKN